MSRHYVLGSWANADEYDYSGEQLMGNRHGASVCMDHMLSNGKANLKRYADAPIEAPKKPKAKRSAFQTITLADNHLNRMEKLSEGLEKEFEQGQLSWDDYLYAKRLIEERKEKAYRRVCKARNWTDNDSSPQLLTLESIENFHYTQHNESPIISSKDSETDKLFSSLSEGNMFKAIYFKIKRIVEALK